MKKQLCGLLVVFVLQAGCGKHSDDPKVETQAEQAVNDNRTVISCVRSALPPNWRIKRANQTGALSIDFEARAADLQIPHRPGPYRQQEFVDVSLGKLRSYHILDPKRLPQLLADGTIKPTAVEGIDPEALGPFTAFASGGSTFLVNEAGGEYCLKRAVPADWPNPHFLCQIVRGELSATATFSVDALPVLDQAIDSIRVLIRQIQACLPLKGDKNNG